MGMLKLEKLDEFVESHCELQLGLVTGTIALSLGVISFVWKG